MSRPALLAAVAVVALAGCLGPVAGPGDESASTTTNDPSPTATATSTPYPDEFVAFPDGPKERPTLPAELNETSAAEYAVAHEYRYSYNEWWEGPDTGIGFSEHSCHASDVEADHDGYRVVVECEGYVNRPAGTDTTATEHLDLAPWTAVYYLDADSVLRTERE